MECISGKAKMKIQQLLQTQKEKENPSDAEKIAETIYNYLPVTKKQYGKRNIKWIVAGLRSRLYISEENKKNLAKETESVVGEGFVKSRERAHELGIDNTICRRTSRVGNDSKEYKATMNK